MARERANKTAKSDGSGACLAVEQESPSGAQAVDSERTQDVGLRTPALVLDVSEMTAALDVIEDAARRDGVLDGLSGLHLHTNCDSADLRPLLKTVQHIDAHLGGLLERLEWVNLGGGYLFTEADDFAPFHEAAGLLRDKYGVEVFIEPGADLVRAAGRIVSTVIDMFHVDGKTVAVLDTTVNHMSEVLEFNYCPPVVGDTDDASDPEGSDNHSLKVVLTVETLCPEVLTVAECVNPENEVFFRRAHCDSVVCIASLAEQMLVQELQDPGIAQIVSELTSNARGRQFYIIDLPAAEGTYAEVRKLFDAKDAVTMGIRRDEENFIAPPDDFAIRQGDRLILVASHRPT